VTTSEKKATTSDNQCFFQELWVICQEVLPSPTFAKKISLKKYMKYEMQQSERKKSV